MRRILAALALTATLLAPAAPADGMGRLHVARHCQGFDPLPMDGGIDVCTKLGYRASGDGLKGTDLWITVPHRCHFMESKAFKRISVRITTRTGSVVRHLTPGGCKRYGHPHGYHRRINVQANSPRASVRIILQAARDAAPDAFYSKRFTIYRSGHR